MNYTQEYIGEVGNIMGVARGIRNGINNMDENLLITVQEVLLAMVIVELRRGENLTLEKLD